MTNMIDISRCGLFEIPWHYMERDYLEWSALQVNMEHLPKYYEWKERGL